MRMDEGLDTGPMLLRAAVPIGPQTRLGALHDVLAALGADLVLRALAEDPPPVPQPADGATYAPRLTRADGRIDWTLPPRGSSGRRGAFDPWPGAFSTFGQEVLKVLEAVVVEGAGRTRSSAGRSADGRLRHGSVAHPEATTGRSRPDGCGRVPARLRIAGGQPAGRVTTAYALLIEYDGRGFVGWQFQDNGRSIQQVVEEAAAHLAGGASVACAVAGRTDAGVHAEGQVAMIALPGVLPPDRVRDALNFYMKPHAVVVREAALAPEGWHPALQGFEAALPLRHPQSPRTAGAGNGARLASAARGGCRRHGRGRAPSAGAARFHVVPGGELPGQFTDADAGPVWMCAATACMW